MGVGQGYGVGVGVRVGILDTAVACGSPNFNLPNKNLILHYLLSNRHFLGIT